LAANTLQPGRYAQAVFEIAQERKELDKWQADLQRIAALAQNAEFVAVMENPKFKFEDKSKLLLAQIGTINSLALNFALLITSQGQFGLVSDIYTEYQQLLDRLKGIEKAEVVTAVTLTEKEIAELAERLGKLTAKKVVLTARVDPGIIGGIVVRIGGKLMDGSTSNQLAALRNELAGSGS
jgi:F-type H+-transporting ATPase subunit delta